MASDFEMGNASDRSEVGDADSLASTAESEQETEYLVNDIHAERRFFVEPDSEDDEGVFITQYLVEWAGYSMDRCSWEPKEMFTSEETLDGWEEKKRRLPRNNLPQAKSARLANPDIVNAHELEAGIASRRAPSRLSVDATSSALSVPAETSPPSKQAMPRQSQQQIAPPRPAISSAQKKRNDPPGSTNLIAKTQTTPSQRPNSRLARLAKNVTAKENPPASQKSPPQAAKPILSSFGTGLGAKRAYRDRKWGERAPDLSQMELMKPSEFAPRMNIGPTTPVVGSSVTSLKSPEAENQPASEIPVSLPDLLQPHSSQINDKDTQQPKKHVVLASSSAMAPPMPRSSTLECTASVSSAVVLLAPSAQSSPQRINGPIDSTMSISSPDTRSKPVPLANLTHTADSADSLFLTLSPSGEDPLRNPAGRSTSALHASSPAPYPHPASQANVDKPTGPSASTSSVFPSVVLSGVRADTTSVKDTRPSGSNITLSSTIPIKPRAMVILERPGENQTSQESRETVRGWDTYRPYLPRQPNNTTMADTYRPSELSRRSSPSRRQSPSRRPSPHRRSPPHRRSSPHRRSPPHRRSSPSRRPLEIPRRSPSPGQLSRSFRGTSGDYARRSPSPSPSHSQLASRSSNSIGLNGNPLSNAQAFAPTEPRADRAEVPAQLNRPIAAQIATVPVRNPRGSRNIAGYWLPKGETLIHIFVGPDKRLIGASRAKGSILSTGWIEGFSDTSENLFRLAEDLRKDDLIAIHYSPGKRNGAGIVWVAWSRGSQEFKFPHPGEVPPGVPLLFAARTMLAPIEVLRTLGSSQPSGRPCGPLPDTSLSLRSDPPSADDSLKPSSSPRQTNYHHDMRMSGFLQSREWPIPAPVQSFPPASEARDNSICANPQPQDNIAIQGGQMDQTGHQVVEDFMKALKINVEELAIIEEGGKSSKASIFYLHFPSDDEEVKEELRLLQAHLGYHEKIVLTSDNPGDWTKFVQNSRQGVAIFHESFVGYDTLLPPLNSFLPTNSFNYWIVRIRRPLELVDPRYCSPGDYHLRIFPYGGVILLTEDVLTNLKGVAITLQWIRNANRNKRRSWTLMFHPGIVEWIERRLDDEHHSQDHGLLLLIHALIIKNNVTDPRAALFDKASLHPNSKSNVIAPALNEYGTRTEHHSLRIKGKAERDTDHLIEFFAGWSLINIPRFRNFIAVTSFNAPVGERWEKWGHITVMRGGFEHFFKRFKINSEALMGYLSGSGDPKPRPSTSQVATPLSVTTPQTPNWASHNSNASIQSTFTGSPNGNSTNKYPTPYK
ncbi:Chromo domain/shadow [Penicillium cf. griseofulvum]|nr:Chromo domain/shadow [Penicillium cf. griseofulvum]